MYCLMVIGGKQARARPAERPERSTLRAEPGEIVSSLALAGPADAKTIRIRDGDRAVTDGPCSAFTARLAGCHVIVCETLDRAIHLAAALRDPGAIAVEVRPLMHHAGLEM